MDIWKNNGEDSKFSVKSIKTLKILLLVLVFTNIMFGYMWFSSSHVEEEHLVEYIQKYPLIDPARNFIDQKDFIVNIQPLREQLYELVEKEGPDSISVYFEFLNTGANISINNDLRIWPASLLKVPMAMAVMKNVETDKWELDDEFILFSEDQDSEYGDFWKTPIGTRLSIEELLQTMLLDSDNTAYRIFLRNIDLDDLLAVVSELGLEGLFNEQGLMTTKEYSRFFRSLYTSSYLQREYSEKLLTYLSVPPEEKLLSRGFPDTVLFAHKFGTNKEYDVALDSGIVYVPNRPFILTVAIQGAKGEDDARVKRVMERIAQLSYQYVSTQ